MPRGNAQNPFCLFEGTVRIPQAKIGDFVEVLASPNADPTHKIVGHTCEVYHSYSNQDVCVRTPNYQIYGRLLWTRGDRWRVVNPPVEAKTP